MARPKERTGFSNHHPCHQGVEKSVAFENRARQEQEKVRVKVAKALEDDMLSLFEQGDHSDLTVASGGSEVEAHRCVLQARSRHLWQDKWITTETDDQGNIRQQIRLSGGLSEKQITDFVRQFYVVSDSTLLLEEFLPFFPSDDVTSCQAIERVETGCVSMLDNLSVEDMEAGLESSPVPDRMGISPGMNTSSAGDVDTTHGDAHNHNTEAERKFDGCDDELIQCEETDGNSTRLSWDLRNGGEGRGGEMQKLTSCPEQTSDDVLQLVVNDNDLTLGDVMVGDESSRNVGGDGDVVGCDGDVVGGGDGERGQVLEDVKTEGSVDSVKTEGSVDSVRTEGSVDSVRTACQGESSFSIGEGGVVNTLDQSRQGVDGSQSCSGSVLAGLQGQLDQRKGVDGSQCCSGSVLAGLQGQLDQRKGVDGSQCCSGSVLAGLQGQLDQRKGVDGSQCCSGWDGNEGQEGDEGTDSGMNDLDVVAAVDSDCVKTKISLDCPKGEGEERVTVEAVDNSGAHCALKSELSEAIRDSNALSIPYETCNSVGRDFLQMYLQQNKCDICLSVDGVKFLAHKCILAARSSYFAAMLGGKWCESGMEDIQLQGVSAQAVEQLLLFLYGGVMELCTPSDLMELFIVMDMYSVVTLKFVLEFYVRKDLCHFFHKPCSACVATASSALILCHSFYLEELQERCLKWSVKYFPKIWSNKSFANLPEDVHQKCAQSVLAGMTESSVLDVIIECTKLSTSLPRIKWTESILYLTTQLMDWAIEYTSSHFIQVLRAPEFLQWGKVASWKAGSLEEIFNSVIDSLPIDTACAVYQTLVDLKTTQSDLEVSDQDILDLLDTMVKRCEKFLRTHIHQVARSKQWASVGKSLQSQILENSSYIHLDQLPDPKPRPMKRPLPASLVRPRPSSAAKAPTRTPPRPSSSSLSSSSLRAPSSSSQRPLTADRNRVPKSNPPSSRASPHVAPRHSKPKTTSVSQNVPTTSSTSNDQLGQRSTFTTVRNQLLSKKSSTTLSSSAPSPSRPSFSTSATRVTPKISKANPVVKTSFDKPRNAVVSAINRSTKTKDTRVGNSKVPIENKDKSLSSPSTPSTRKAVPLAKRTKGKLPASKLPMKTSTPSKHENNKTETGRDDTQSQPTVKEDVECVGEHKDVKETCTMGIMIAPKEVGVQGVGVGGHKDVNETCTMGITIAPQEVGVQGVGVGEHKDVNETCTMGITIAPQEVGVQGVGVGEHKDVNETCTMGITIAPQEVGVQGVGVGEHKDVNETCTMGITIVPQEVGVQGVGVGGSADGHVTSDNVQQLSSSSTDDTRSGLLAGSDDKVQWEGGWKSDVLRDDDVDFAGGDKGGGGMGVDGGVADVDTAGGDKGGVGVACSDDDRVSVACSDDDRVGVACSDDNRVCVACSDDDRVGVACSDDDRVGVACSDDNRVCVACSDDDRVGVACSDDDRVGVACSDDDRVGVACSDDDRVGVACSDDDRVGVACSDDDKVGVPCSGNDSVGEFYTGNDVGEFYSGNDVGEFYSGNDVGEFYSGNESIGKFYSGDDNVGDFHSGNDIIGEFYTDVDGFDV